ncbi:MAG: Lrp/AsnC family transcriptional regulator [Acutalibacteraceae bacterium]|nr:Lrp/AsnC family transcriptional regulator [Clostridia bacterium]MEE1143875.1 Lrp/AsnC family transcriptional regulator [Acutalibacteraceae bacterium]
MTDIERKIIKILSENARYSSADLSSMLGITEKQVDATIEKLENENIICGYPAIIDWDKTDGETVTALIELKVTPKKALGFEEIAESITNCPEVESVYLMSGGYDLCVTVKGHTFKEVSMFVAKRLATMDGVVSTATHFVLRKYKEVGTVLENKHADDRGMFLL